MRPSKTLAETHKQTNSIENVVAGVEFLVRAELHDGVETDFVHSILGTITAETGSRGKEDAGRIQGSLVQFGETLDHGIVAERLGDGISGDISEYWEHLLDVETGYPKEEIQNEFEVVDLINSSWFSPHFKPLIPRSKPMAEPRRTLTLFVEAEEDSPIKRLTPFEAPRDVAYPYGSTCAS
jgi:hypothetical protein